MPVRSSTMEVKIERKIVKEAGKMGALIWGIFVLIVTVVMERDCFFS